MNAMEVFRPEPDESRPHLLIFDLEGLLWDARTLRVRALAESLTEVAHSLGLDLDFSSADALDVLSSNIEKGMVRLGSELQGTRLAELLDGVERAKLANIRAGSAEIHPEMIQSLEGLKALGCRIAIHSLQGRDYLLGVIDYFQLHRYIDMAICSADVSGTDPGLGLLEILENQETLRGETLYISNQAEMLAVARKHDMASVGCCWGVVSEKELTSADRVIQSPRDLLDLVLPMEGFKDERTGR